MPGDVNFASVSALLHFDGANGAVTTVDKSLTPKTATFVGDAQISTAQSVFGGSSLLLDGAGDYVSLGDHADFELLALDFFLEARIRLTGYGINYGGSSVGAILGKDLSGDRSYNWILAGPTGSWTTMFFDGYDASGTLTRTSVPFAPALNTWYSVAVGRSGNLIYFFVDGVLQNPGGTAFNTTLKNSAQTLKVGAALFDGSNQYYYTGYIDELRVTKGVCRATATYTPAAAPFEDGEGVVSGVIKDVSGANAARVVRAYRRDTGALLGSMTSDGTTGAYSFYTPTLDEVTILALDSATSGTYYDDICERVIPA